jgi:hypothetical protein
MTFLWKKNLPLSPGKPRGQRQLFRTLGPKEGYVQPTFVTNPWVVTDANGACIAVYLPENNPGRAIVFGKKHE